MSKTTYNLKGSLSTNQYGKLLRFASKYCNSFLPVIRETVSLRQPAIVVLKDLEPFLLSQNDESQWYGTKLFNSIAKVQRYKLTSKSTAILEKLASNLFSRVQPDLPEDLCLIRDNEEPFPVTIAHEKDSYSVLFDKEKLLLETEIPDIQYEISGF